MRASIREEKTISTTEAIRRLKDITVLTLGDNALNGMLRSFGGDALPGVQWVIPISLLAPLAQYWNTWGNKQKNRPTFAEWCKSENLKVEKPYRYIIEPPKAPESKPPRSAIEEAAFMRKIIREEIKAAMVTSPTVLIGDGTQSVSRDNDARIRAIEDDIAVFQRDHDISRKSALVRLEEIFRSQHPLYAPCREGQEFLLWLRTSGHMDEFYKDIRGMLDALHDEFSSKKVSK